MTKFEKLIKNSTKILIISSQPLDLDTIASGLLLKKYLEYLGFSVTFRFPKELTQDEIELNKYIPLFNDFTNKDTRDLLTQDDFDTLILLDGVNWIQFYDFKNTSLPAPSLNKNKLIIQIDHHFGNPEDLASIQIKNSSASSTTEILLDQIIPHEFLDKNLATLAYLGLMGDTGNFRWKMNPTTFELAAMLLKKGADPTEAIEHMFGLKPKKYMNMLKYVLENIEYDDLLKTVFLFLPLEKQRADKIGGNDYKYIKDAFVNEVSISIQDYDRGILIAESERKGKIKITGRGSTLFNKINLQDFFKSIGGNGGGHFNASGMEIEDNFENVKIKLKAALSEYFYKKY